MKTIYKQILEVSLIFAFAEYGKKSSKGRVKSQFQKLTKLAKNSLEVMPNLPDSEVIGMANCLNDFQEKTGWTGENRHPATTASFCLELIESSKFNYNPRIFKTLSEIVDYYDRAKKVPGPSFWSGSVAAQKWQNIIEGV